MHSMHLHVLVVSPEILSITVGPTILVWLNSCSHLPVVQCWLLLCSFSLSYR